MIRTFVFNKLIRDKMYEMMKSQGAKIEVIDIKSQKEAIGYFQSKLMEEAEEVSTANIIDEILEEMADCIEVINGFLKLLNISKDSLEAIRKKKYDERGGFEKPVMVGKITVSSTETDPEYYKFFIQYCEKAKDKYPEVISDVNDDAKEYV
jgi:predicted house-cleaning noncanonical NTP pyrophosphatase (MazG superfamily)